MAKLSWAFAVLSVLRSSLSRLLKQHVRDTIVNEADRQAKMAEIKEAFKSIDSEFSHQTMLIPFLFCVYPRSMDSLCDNRGLAKYDAQALAFAEAALNRLAYPSGLQVEGWRLIPAVAKLLTKFNMDPNECRCEIEVARHPSNALLDFSTKKTFDQILSEGGTLIRMVSPIINLLINRSMIISRDLLI